jgi:hypothetical protein
MQLNSTKKKWEAYGGDRGSDSYSDTDEGRTIENEIENEIESGDHSGGTALAALAYLDEKVEQFHHLHHVRLKRR